MTTEPTLSPASVPNSPIDPITEIADRRRPGRPEIVSPELIPLLRSAEELDFPTPPFPWVDEPEDRGVLAFPTGLVMGFGLSAVLWAMIIGVVWSVTR